MEHSEAMSSNAAERYLLGDLGEAEAESFEDHFFECRICGEEIREGTRALEALQAVAREDRPDPAVVVPFKPRPSRWLGQAVAALLTIGISVSLIFNYLRPITTQIEFATLDLNAPTRAAAEPEPSVPAGNKPLLLRIDVPSEPPYPRYVLSVRDKRGDKVMTSKSVPAAETEERVLLLLSVLPAVGSYEVVIEGVRGDGNRSKITTRSFQVRP
jgi:hypothetical protein